MSRTVGKGTTALVSGPASVVLVEGRVIVLGSTIYEGDKIVVRKGRTVPFEAAEESIIDVVLGLKAEIQEIQGSTIPASWEHTCDEILAQPKPLTIYIVGGVDRGKTTLCTYLANKAFAHDIRTAVVDADVGQTNLGPPATVSYATLTKQITDLFTLDPTAIQFIGQTSPANATERVVHAVTLIAERIMEAQVPFTVINTDGWIEGTTACEYKLKLLQTLRPGIVIGIQLGEELEHILRPAEAYGVRVFRVPPSLRTRSRDRDTRRELREQGYMRYLKNAVLRSLPLNWIRFEDVYFETTVEQDANRLDTFQEKLRVRVLHYAETAREVTLVIDDEQDPDRSKIESLEEELGKTIRLLKEGEEKGLLVGLLDQDRQYLGLGVIHSIDFRARTIKLFTSFKETFDGVQLGRVRVDKFGREYGTTTVFTPTTG